MTEKSKMQIAKLENFSVCFFIVLNFFIKNFPNKQMYLFICFPFIKTRAICIVFTIKTSRVKTGTGFLFLFNSHSFFCFFFVY